MERSIILTMVRSLLEAMISPTTDTESQNTRNRLWGHFWILCIVGFTFLGIVVFYYTRISPEFNRIQPYIVPTIFISTIAGYFLSTKMAPEGYSHFKQAICHLGRIRTKKGSLNLKSSAIFAITFLLQSGNLLFLIPKLIHYVPSNPAWIYITVACILTAITTLLTGMVPIDLFEKSHVRLGLVSVVSGTTWILIILYGLWLHGFGTPLINSLALSLNTIAILYMIGYFSHYRYTGFLQKIWMLIINFAVVVLFYIL